MTVLELDGVGFFELHKKMKPWVTNHSPIDTSEKGSKI